jgi:lysozyme
MMKLSDDGIKFLKDKEGVRNRVYDDGAGYLTVGVGHKLIGQELDNYKLGSFVPDCQVDAWLRIDVEVAERCVNNWVVVPLTQTGFDMLVSFVYNVGCDAFKKSTLLRQLNRGRIRETSEEFKKWVFSNKKRMAGLVARRAEESRKFLEAEAAQALEV